MYEYTPLVVYCNQYILMDISNINSCLLYLVLRSHYDFFYVPPIQSDHMVAIKAQPLPSSILEAVACGCSLGTFTAFRLSLNPQTWAQLKVMKADPELSSSA